MQREIEIALTVSMGLAYAVSAHADWSASAGAEHFSWRESGSPSVKEKGLRWALDLTWAQSKEPGFSAGYNVRLYYGRVDYEGAFLFSGLPATTKVRYSGLTNEARLFYRIAQNPLAVFAAVGWDQWERKFPAPQKESYDIYYVKAGGTYNDTVKQGVTGSAGIKYPISTREDAHLTDIGFSNNQTIRPGKQVSLYGTVGYRFKPDWDVIAYYDSYRFKQSRVVDAGGGFFVFQPESKMDVVGVKAQYNF
jgi:hypothetical protein